MTSFSRILLATTVGLCAANAAAQSSGDLLSKFQNLPPDQQQEIINSAKSQNLALPPQNTQAGPPQTQQPAGPEMAQPAAPGNTQAAGPAAASAGKEHHNLSDFEADKDLAGKLKPFGYDLFSRPAADLSSRPTSNSYSGVASLSNGGLAYGFVPASDVPVPKDYPIGPGDDVEVQLFGKQNLHYSLMVQRDGSIQFPEFGPIQVSGMTFDDMRQMLSERIASQMIGVKSAITMGPLRTIRVFVLGDVNQPGSYTVSALSTITNALFLSGGVAETGSLRRIQLKRQGQIVAAVDLYDLLLSGDTKTDARVEPGDVIFIPPVGATVGISGEVKRPAIYELTGGEHVSDLVRYAGGLIPSAIPSLSTIVRWQNDKKIVLNANFHNPAGNLAVDNGDVIAITRSLDQLRGLVSLTGHVERDRVIEWHAGMRISDIVPSVDHLQALPDLGYGLVIRKSPDRQRISVINFRPADVFSAPGSAGDPVLQERDIVKFFGLDAGRGAAVADVSNQLRFQAREGEKPLLVRVSGAVEEPGTYPLTENMRLRDLIAAGLRLSKNAETAIAYVLRRPDPTADLQALTVQLKPGSADLDNFALQSNDTLVVMAARGEVSGESDCGGADEEHGVTGAATSTGCKVLSGRDFNGINEELRQQARPDAPAMVFSISGAVKFPGEYPLVGELSLAQALEIAGGYTEPAYSYTAEITHAARNTKGAFIVLPEEIQLADPAALAKIHLASRDSVIIRRQPGFDNAREITLGGEVKFPGSYRVRKGDFLSDVILRAGGFTDQANIRGGVFTRVSVRDSEQRRLDELRSELQKDLLRLSNKGEQASVASSSAGGGKTDAASQLALIQNIAGQLATVKAIGRMAIDLPAIIHDDADADLVIQDGDALFVPPKTEEVLVIGEVLYPSAMHYLKHGEVDDYIHFSGGTTQSADTKRTYLIKADGHVIGRASGSWFGSGDSVEPGDTVVVPLDTRPLDFLPLTTGLATILGNLAITAASLHSVGGI